MSRFKTRFYIDVEIDDSMTDAESVATALDRLMETALSTPGILEEYGDPKVGEFMIPEYATPAMVHLAGLVGISEQGIQSVNVSDWCVMGAIWGRLCDTIDAGGFNPELVRVAEHVGFDNDDLKRLGGDAHVAGAIIAKLIGAIKERKPNV